MKRRKSELLRSVKKFSNRSKNMETNSRFPKDLFENFLERAVAIRKRHREGIESKSVIVNEINSLNESITMYLRGNTEFPEFLAILEDVREWLYLKKDHIERKYLKANQLTKL